MFAKKNLRVISIAGCVLLGSALSAGAAWGLEALASNSPQMSASGVYSVNQAGETYGPQSMVTDEEPDLIAAVGVGGVSGYIKQADIDKYGGGFVNTPEEAIGYMESEAKEPAVIPLYESDGQTVIGEFMLSSPQASRSTRDDIQLGVHPAAYATSAGTAESPFVTAKGYKHSYKAHSAVTTKGKKAWSHTWIYNKKVANVPTGYMGALARLYDASTGKAIESSKWAYNSEARYGFSVMTAIVSVKSGKYYYGKGKFRVYNGDGYDTHICKKTPNVKAADLGAGVISPAILQDGEVGLLPNGQYRINRNGNTYGSGMAEDIVGFEPDLIAAVGEDGEDGFIKAADFETAGPQVVGDKSDAVNKAIEEYVPLYDKEENIIGRFKTITRITEITEAGYSQFMRENKDKLLAMSAS